MNILIVSDVFPPNCGGVGWGAFYLAKALQKQGHKVTVVTSFGESEEYGGLKIIQCPPKGLKELAHKELRSFLKKLIQKETYDVINPHHIISLRASVGLGIPLAATVNDFWPVCYKGTLFNSHFQKNYDKLTWWECFKSVFFENGVGIKLLSIPITVYMKIRTWLSRKALKKADAISFLSKCMSDKMSTLFPNIPQTITYHICANEVDVEKIPVKKFEKPTIVFVGKFNANKGALLTVKIAKLVPEADFLMIGGTREQLSSQEPLPDNLKIIKYIPNSEVFSFMKSADVYLAPALWHEPLGRIVIEAIAMGTPAVISARGGMHSDIIKHDFNGIVVQPLAAQSFAMAIKALLKDKAKLEKLGTNARKDFLERFNEEAIVDQFMDLYNKAINHHKSGNMEL